MLRLIPVLTVIAAFTALPVLSGCEREVAHERKVDVREDGTVKKSETKVTETPDGGVKKTETKTVDRP